MKKLNSYDIIIAGAGASGLSLLWYLLNSDSVQNKQILLIDKELVPNDSKTWCFWDDGSFKMQEFITHTWKSIRVDIHSESHISKLNKYSYHCIRSIDFTTRILKLANMSPNITLLESDIIDFKSDRGLGVVKTTSGDFQAPYIFQSVIKPKEATSDISMIQHFLGWEIELSDELFDPTTAVLMDFDVDQTLGFSFMYLLPFSRRHALIEYTLFSNGLLSDEQYEKVLRHYLTHTLKLKSSDYQVRRKEKGAIPMEDRRYQLKYCDHVYNLGSVGGLTKPSTGYTFRRIQDRSIEIVNALESDQKIPATPFSSYRFRVYDMMLLYNLDKDHETSIRIFRDLFKKNEMERVLEFLDEKTTFLQELSIFTSFSPVPFLRSIYYMKHRIFTGA